MTGAGVLAILPLIIPSATVAVLVLLIALRRSHFATALIALVGLSLAFAAVCWHPHGEVQQVTRLLLMDGYAVFYNGLILAAAAATALIAYGYLRTWGGPPEEYYVLLLLATIGAQVLVASSHLVSFFLGLELLSVSLYGLIAYPRMRLISIEAGVKYLVLAASSAAFLLFGMALVYAELGTMELGEIVSRAAARPVGVVFFGALALLVVGIGYKLAIVPFHLWAADVYQGAPAPTTAFIATVSKGAMFALLVRYFVPLNALGGAAQFWMFGVLAIGSMFFGNLLALLQNNLKRMLAYSSIAHIGYLLVAFLAGGELAVTAVTFYLVAYFITSIAAFGVISALSSAEGEFESLSDYEALAWQRPWTATVLSISLFSLAGIPLTAGFIGKFYVITAGASMRLWALLIILVVNSAIGLYYYLRAILMMYRRPAEPLPGPAAVAPLHLTAGVVVTAMALLLLLLGMYPAPLIRLIEGLTAMQL
jgi:NADH-quinone oxidoreductase subunit N